MYNGNMCYTKNYKLRTKILILNVILIKCHDFLPIPDDAEVNGSCKPLNAINALLPLKCLFIGIMPWKFNGTEGLESNSVLNSCGFCIISLTTVVMIESTSVAILKYKWEYNLYYHVCYLIVLSHTINGGLSTLTTYQRVTCAQHWLSFLW